MIFNPSELGVGVFTFVFQPDEEYCYFPFEAEIEVFEESLLTFDIPISFCVKNDAYVLPASSLEGVFGTWDIDELDLSSPIENETVTFEPEDVADCFQEYILTYSVIESIPNTFNIPDTFCRQNNTIVFDSTSIEGNLGFWTPLAVNLDTVTENMLDIFWTPLDNSSECIENTNKSIIIISPVQPDFDLPVSLCQNSGVLVLPFENNGVTYSGSWNIAQFDPDTINSGLVDLVFTSADDCAETFYD